ncbi:hypothetical protein TNCT_99921 [Trichonephila clavata]|uniref:Uncharacterized protein n=1 Tax=Trichonephila clavata TaxID=2740835 RepID=A0A8X6FPU2_TRICU|nr:hypothetical protein TNCT_99921 [Trichonephila clavata]
MVHSRSSKNKDTKQRENDKRYHFVQKGIGIEIQRVRKNPSRMNTVNKIASQKATARHPQKRVGNWSPIHPERQASHWCHAVSVPRPFHNPRRKATEFLPLSPLTRSLGYKG